MFEVTHLYGYQSFVTKLYHISRAVEIQVCYEMSRNYKLVSA